MTATSAHAALDADALRAIDAYRTCEFATISRDGTPMAWPAYTRYNAESATFTLTTSVGLPAKAFNIRRNPRVSLLFSDPTGSGVAGLPQILVQGRASCPDVIVTSPAGLEGYWARLFDRQPAGRRYGASRLSRRFMDWYYFRLVITVTPERFDVRPPLAAGGTAAHRTVAGSDAPARVARDLQRYESQVLTGLDQDGYPASRRVHAAVSDTGDIVLDEDAPLLPGRASLLCHRHDDQMWSLRSVLAVGNTAQSSHGSIFVPERHVPGASGRPLDSVRLLRAARKTADGYLERRQLRRPSVAWDEFAALYDRADLA